MEKNYVIEAKDINKSFGDTEVLKGVSLQVERGTMTALLGPNGAGKTTTVRILSTLLTFNSGTATINGLDVDKQANEVRKNIGLTGQYAAVDEYLTGRQNLRMMGRLYRLSTADAERRGEELLEQFDLMDAADRMAKTYSGGMRRRLDLAISLIATPPIIFLDEPTTGLDPRSRLAMWDVIRKLMDSGATILLTTQYLEEADQLADKIVVIDHGRVIAEGTADELKQKVGKERVEVTFSSTEAFKKAKELIKSEGVIADADKKLISIHTDGKGKEVKDLLVTLEKANIEIDSLNLHKPTLDDVFMQLTGHEAEAAQPDTKEVANVK